MQVRWRDATTGERIVSGSLCMVVVAVFAWLAVTNPTDSGFAPKCLSYRLAGVLCPGCGSSRALHALLRGNPVQALAFNPLFVIVFPFLAVWIGLQGVRAVWGRHLICVKRPALMGYGVLVALLAYALARNLPWPVFDVLRPHESARRVEADDQESSPR